MSPVLSFYARFLSDSELRNTCGYYGYLLELAIKDFFGLPLVISDPKKHDLRITLDGKKRFVEVKENGGNFYNLCRRDSFIFYAVYIDVNKPITGQFGYFMPLSVFRSCGFELKHIRTEKRDGNEIKTALQTLYNYSKGDFHGAKAFKLSTLWEENGAISFKEFFNN